MKEKKWSKDVCVTYLNLFFKEMNFPSYLNNKTPFLENVCVQLNSKYPNKSFDVDSLLCEITRLSLKGILTVFTPSLPGKSKNKIAVFYNSKNKFIGVDKDTLKLELIKSLIKIEDSIDSLGLERVDVIFNPAFSVFENITQITKKHNITEIEACCALYRQDLIEIKNNNIIKKEKGNILKKECNDLLRKEIAKVFNHNGDDYNLYLFNDGTGSGKTHNAVMNYIEDFDNEELKGKDLVLSYIESSDNSNNVFKQSKRHSLIFVAPQKNQLFADVDVYEKAKIAEIPLLFARSLSDLTNLLGKNFFKLNGSEYESVRDFFDDLLGAKKGGKSLPKKTIDNQLKLLFKARNLLIDVKRNGEDKEEELSLSEDNIEGLSDVENTRLSSFTSFYTSYKRYRDFESNYSYEKDHNQEWYAVNLEMAHLDFRGNLLNFARFLAIHIDDNILESIFKSGSLYSDFENFYNLFGDYADLYILAYKLLAFVMPFEVAKHINVIIYMTGDKSQTYMPVSEPHKRIANVKVSRSYDLDEMVSGYKISRKADILSVYKDSSNFSNFLNQKFFEKNGYNYFIKNDLGFSIIYDEEHILYNNLIEEYTFKNITERKNNVQVNISHSLAAIARWIKNITLNERNITNFHKIHTEKTTIIASLFKEIKNHTSLKTDKDVEDFFEAVFCNESGIFVKKSDYEFISSVCDNITSFSPRLIVLKDFLKTVKVISPKGSDNILVSKESETLSNDLGYNMLDFFQVVLTLLYVCRNSSYSLRNLLFTEKEKNNQNNALYHLLNLAHENRFFLNNLFSSSLNLTEDDPVNFQFAYFLTKIGFNFTFPKKIGSHEYSEDSIPVEPNIFIIKELPEVGILHSLKNSKNKVFLLSATRGFQNIFAGNYSEYFFDEVNKLSPNTFKIFKRENQDYNPMPRFVENRFDKRISIDVVKLTIKNNVSKRGNAVDTVEALIYPVKNIDLTLLSNTNDISPVVENYDLVSSNNGNKNYLEDLVYKAKLSDKLNEYGNPFNRAEILGILNSMIHSFEKGEHSIVMTLSNKFKDFLENEAFMKSVFGGNAVQYIRGDENRYKVFEYKPVENSNRKLRVIFFNAEMGKVSNLKDHFILDPDTTVVLVSSYNSAGTGLNLTLSRFEGDKEIKQDFNSIYFVSAPFYTSVKGDKGYGHLSNQLIVYKNFAHNGSKVIKDLSDGLSSRKTKAILYREHLMEKVKSIMQAAGRIERSDISIKTRIYFVENGLTPIFEQAMSEFYEMFKIHSNGYQKTIIANYSMLNKSLLKVSQNHITANCLTVGQRNLLEKESQRHHEIFLDFFSNADKFPRMLNQYRLDNPDFSWVAEFNGMLRDYVSPNYNIHLLFKNFIKKNEIKLKASGFYSSVVNLMPVLEFDFNEHQIPQNKRITIDWDKGCYSDYSHSVSALDDKYFYDYAKELGMHEVDLKDEGGFLASLFGNYRYSSTLTRLPNLYLSHIIRGNVAEKVLSDYLNKKNIKFNNMGILFNKKVEKMLYELFDFYIVRGNNFYAIDTKNWNQYNDAGARKVLVGLDDKIKKIKDCQELKDYKLNFIYLNMFPEQNTAFTESLSNYLGGFEDVQYMNFIQKDINYGQRKNDSDYYLGNDVYRISTEWKKKLG